VEVDGVVVVVVVVVVEVGARVVIVTGTMVVGTVVTGGVVIGRVEVGTAIDCTLTGLDPCELGTCGAVDVEDGSVDGGLVTTDATAFEPETGAIAVRLPGLLTKLQFAVCANAATQIRVGVLHSARVQRLVQKKTLSQARTRKANGWKAICNRNSAAASGETVGFQRIFADGDMVK
jgi:hypothetical protein